MNAKKVNVGKVCLYCNDGLTFLVRIVDSKRSFGHLRYEIMPVFPSYFPSKPDPNTKWVNDSNIQITEA